MSFKLHILEEALRAVGSFMGGAERPAQIAENARGGHSDEPRSGNDY